MSTRSDTNDDMPEKKKKQGRPKVLPPELSTRFQIRCSEKDIVAWTERAEKAGFGSVAAWIRKAANDALKQPVK